MKTNFLFFCLSIYKIVDSKYRMDIYKSAKISIWKVMKNQKNVKICS